MTSLARRLVSVFRRSPEPIVLPPKPAGLSDATKRKLMFAGLSAGSRGTAPQPNIIDWTAMRTRKLTKGD